MAKRYFEPWTLEYGVKVCRELNTALGDHYNCALTGSVLYKGGSTNDLDIIVFPHKSTRCDQDEIFALLQDVMYLKDTPERIQRYWQKLGLDMDYKCVSRWLYTDSDTKVRRMVDVIIPSITTDHTINQPNT